MTDNVQRYEAHNAQYVTSFDKGHLTIPPAKNIAIVTCMDARLHPEKFLGLEIGEAHIIRNAGGRASDALRSLIISQRLLGTKEIVVIHHTDCGMLTFNDEGLRDKVKQETGELVDYLSFLPFSDLKNSVEVDVQWLKEHKLILKDIPITGYIYDVKTGKLEKVV